MRTVVIYSAGEQVEEPMSETTLHIPIPNLMESEKKSTDIALLLARRVQADKVIIYRKEGK